MSHNAITSMAVALMFTGFIAGMFLGWHIAKAKFWGRAKGLQDLRTDEVFIPMCKYSSEENKGVFLYWLCPAGNRNGAFLVETSMELPMKGKFYYKNREGREIVPV